MKIIDLHIHTNHSDGTYSVNEIFQKASDENISAISITDHDTISAIPDACRISEEYNIEFIAGIEFSCIYKNYNLHILGYGFDYKNEEFATKLKSIAESRIIRNKLIVEKLKNYNIFIDYNELEKTSKGTLTRANIAKQMVDKGYSFSIKDAFLKYLDYDAPCYVKREKIQAEYIIDMIHKAGGVAFLAHVNQIKTSRFNLENLILELKELGLDGIEAFYPEYSDKTLSFCNEVCEKFSLLKSGGSDFHGKIRDNSFGYISKDVYIPYEFLEKIKNKLG